MTILDIARLFRFVRELPTNKGQRVEAIQKWGGGKVGEAWCAYYATMVLDLYYQGKSPIDRTGGCDEILKQARARGLIVDHPVPGDLFLRMKAPDDAVHVGFVTSPIAAGKFGRISGNTSQDGLSNNGDGVYERPVPYVPDRYVFIRLP